MPTVFFSPGTGPFARFFWHAADINNGHGLTTAVNPLANVTVSSRGKCESNNKIYEM